MKSAKTITVAFEINHLTGAGLEHLIDRESGEVVISFFDGNECDYSGAVRVIDENDTLDLSE